MIMTTSVMSEDFCRHGSSNECMVKISDMIIIIKVIKTWLNEECSLGFITWKDSLSCLKSRGANGIKELIKLFMEVKLTAKLNSVCKGCWESYKITWAFCGAPAWWRWISFKLAPVTLQCWDSSPSSLTKWKTPHYIVGGLKKSPSPSLRSVWKGHSGDELFSHI